MEALTLEQRRKLARVFNGLRGVDHGELSSPERCVLEVGELLAAAGAGWQVSASSSALEVFETVGLRPEGGAAPSALGPWLRDHDAEVRQILCRFMGAHESAFVQRPIAFGVRAPLFDPGLSALLAREFRPPTSLWVAKGLRIFALVAGVAALGAFVPILVRRMTSFGDWLTELPTELRHVFLIGLVGGLVWFLRGRRGDREEWAPGDAPRFRRMQRRVSERRAALLGAREHRRLAFLAREIARVDPADRSSRESDFDAVTTLFVEVEVAGFEWYLDVAAPSRVFRAEQALDRLGARRAAQLLRQARARRGEEERPWDCERKPTPRSLTDLDEVLMDEWERVGVLLLRDVDAEPSQFPNRRCSWIPFWRRTCRPSGGSTDGRAPGGRSSDD